MKSSVQENLTRDLEQRQLKLVDLQWKINQVKTHNENMRKRNKMLLEKISKIQALNQQIQNERIKINKNLTTNQNSIRSGVHAKK